MVRACLIVVGLGLYLAAGVTAFPLANEHGDAIDQAGVIVLCAAMIVVGTMMRLAGTSRQR